MHVLEYTPPESSSQLDIESTPVCRASAAATAHKATGMIHHQVSLLASSQPAGSIIFHALDRLDLFFP